MIWIISELTRNLQAINTQAINSNFVGIFENPLAYT